MSKRNLEEEDDQAAVTPVFKRTKLEHKDGQGTVPSASKRRLRPEDYTIGWCCPLEIEQTAALEMLDEEHQRLPQAPTDHTVYTRGSIGGHNVVMAGMYMPGNNPAAAVITQMRT